MPKSWEVLRNKLNIMATIRGFKADLARKMGIHSSLIQAYLDGTTTPGIDQIDRFAEALGLQTWELIKPDNAIATPMKKEPGNAELLAALVELQAKVQELEQLKASSPGDPLIKNKAVTSLKSVSGNNVPDIEADKRFFRDFAITADESDLKRFRRIIEAQRLKSRNKAKGSTSGSR